MVSSQKRKRVFANVVLMIIIGFLTGVAADSLTIQNDLNEFYVKLNEQFSNIANSSELKSTRLKVAERVFVRTLRKNRAYYSLLRTNSKGKIISEVIRGNKVERPLRDISNQRWFSKVKNSREDFYSLIKDNDRGRYYLFWCKPVIKGDRFVGSVLAKIDLWDSFYEFSNSIYYPFLIKLNNFSLFSHKWQDDYTSKREELSIPGIDNVSVQYIPEKKKVEPSPSTTAKDTLTKAVAAPVNEEKPKEKKSSFPLSALFVFLLILVGAGLAFIVIRKKMREKSLFDMIDNE